MNRSYAEVAKRKGEEKETEKGSSTVERPPLSQPPPPPPTVNARAVVRLAAPLHYKPGTRRRWIKEDNEPKRAQAVVMRAAPLRYKPGTMWKWIEDDNRGVQIIGIRD